MRINKLHVKSFRNISDTTLDLGDGEKFIVVRAKNGQGKTSLAESISLNLTPTTWGLDGQGAGFARKIKRGETKSVLEVDLEGAKRTIRRTVSLSVGASGRTPKSEDLSDPSWNPVKFDRLLEDRKTALGISINTRQFMSMIYSGDEKAQKNLLAQLVLPAHYDFPKDTIADVDSVLGQGTIKFDGEPFIAIEMAYKKLFSERQDCNRRVKNFIVPDSLPIPQGVNSVSLQTKLADLRGSRVVSSAERDAAVKKSNEEEVSKVRVKARIDTLEASIRAGKEALSRFNEGIIPDFGAVQEVAGRKEQYESLIGKQRSLLAALEANKKERNRLNQAPEGGTVCPMCEQEVDGDLLTSLAAKTVAEGNRLTSEYVAVTQSLGALGDVLGAIAKVEKHKAAVGEKGEVEAKLAESIKYLAEAKAELGPSTPSFDFTPYDSTLADTDEKIEAILQQLRPVIAAEEREKEIATKKEQLKKLEDKAAKLDSLVKLFDKDGIKAKLIAQYITGFENQVNEVLKVWGYSCSLSIDPFKFEITDYRGVSTPLIELSGAEELMFYAAFQCAVSRTAGIGFVVIDRVDTLLPELRPKMYAKLYDMVENKVLDQVILLVADTSEQVPKLADSAFFFIDDGNIRRLE